MAVDTEDKQLSPEQLAEQESAADSNNTDQASKKEENSLAGKDGGFFRNEKSSGLLNKAKSKKGFLLGGAGLGLGFLIVMALLLWIGSFKSIHFATVLRSAGFAKFNLIMNRRFSQVLFDTAVLTDGSTGTLELEKRTMLDRLRGINPEKQLKVLGEEGIVKFEFEQGRSWNLRKTNDFKGIQINGESFNLDTVAKDLGHTSAYKDLSVRERMGVRAEFVSKVETGLSERLALERRYVRNSVYDGIRQATDIKMTRWRQAAREFIGKTPDEARSLSVEKAVDDVNGSAVGAEASDTKKAVDEALDDVKTEASEGRPVNVPDIVEKAAERRVEVAGIAKEASAAVFLTTTYCIGRDLVGSFTETSRLAQENAMRQGHMALTTADQIKSGDTTAEAVGADAESWDGIPPSGDNEGIPAADSSISYQRDTGNPDAQLMVDSQAPSILPGNLETIAKFLQTIDNQSFALVPVPGFNEVVKLVPGFDNATAKIKDVTCDAMLHPVVQFTEAGLEVAAAAALAGTSEAAIQGGGRAIGFAVVKSLGRSGVEFAATVGFGELIGKVLEAAVSRFSGLDFNGAAQGADRYSQSRVGVDLLEQANVQQGSYGRPLTDEESAEVEVAVRNQQREDMSEKSWQERYFAISNPYSLVGQLSTVAPSSTNSALTSTASFFNSLGTQLNFTKRLTSSVFAISKLGDSSAYAQSVASQEEIHSGVKQWGYSIDEQNLMNNDISYSILENAKIVEADSDGRFAQFEKDYGSCFSADFLDVLNKVEGSDLHDKCTAQNLSGETALRYRIYNGLDNYVVTELSEDYENPTGEDTAAASNSSVYMLGDSLSVGMRDSGGVEDKLKAKGWSSVQVSAICGRHLKIDSTKPICQGDSGPVPGGIAQLSQDQQAVKDAGVIVVGLGTNDPGSSSYKTDVSTMIDNIKAFNPSAKVYWINLFSTDASRSLYPSMNTTLKELSGSKGFTVIDWASVANTYYDPGNLHPKDYGGMAEFIVNALGEPPEEGN